jgi:hypothetical protein
MTNEKPKLTKDQLKKKLDTLGEEIKYRAAEAKKGGGTGDAHKTDIGELMKGYRNLKETYGKVLQTEQDSLQLEDILSNLAEEKEEDPKKAKEREELHKNRIDSFADLIELASKIKMALPKAKKETEKYYKDNPNSFAVVHNTEEMKDTLTSILEKLTGNKENTKE